MAGEVDGEGGGGADGGDEGDAGAGGRTNVFGVTNAGTTPCSVAGYPAVFPGGNTFTHHIAHRLFEREGLKPNISMSTNYMETIKMMVSIGIAWSVLPRTMLDDQVVRLPLPGVQLSRQLGYIVHTERTLSNAATAFMALLDAERNTPRRPEPR